MTHITQQFGNSLQSFARDEEGAQIIEYALIVAVVSLVLILAIQSKLTSTAFAAWVQRVADCLAGGTTVCK